jgi:hypothetical protein
MTTTAMSPATRASLRDAPCPFSGARPGECRTVPYIPQGGAEYAHSRWHDLQAEAVPVAAEGARP